MIAFDMTTYTRVISVGGDGDGRISGSFEVMGVRPREDGEDISRSYWVYPHDVTIWDSAGSSGIVMHRDDFSGFVRDGVVSFSFLSRRMTDELTDPQVRAEMTQYLRLVVQAYEGGVGSEVRYNTKTEATEFRAGAPVPKRPDYPNPAEPPAEAELVSEPGLICKHCGAAIASNAPEGQLWHHTATMLGRCQDPDREYGYNAEPVGEECQGPCLGTYKADPTERTK